MIPTALYFAIPVTYPSNITLSNTSIADCIPISPTSFILACHKQATVIAHMHTVRSHTCTGICKKASLHICTSHAVILAWHMQTTVIHPQHPRALHQNHGRAFKPTAPTHKACHTMEGIQSHSTCTPYAHTHSSPPTCSIAVPTYRNYMSLFQSACSSKTSTNSSHAYSA